MSTRLRVSRGTEGSGKIRRVMEMGRIVAAVALGVLLGVGANGFAHHIEVNEFDRSRPVTLTGEVVKVQWINPHPWIYIKVVGDDGEAHEWAFEAAAPMNLLRRGFTPASIPLGEVITLDGYQAKDGALRANGQTLTWADGTEFYIGYLGLIGTGEAGQ